MTMLDNNNQTEMSFPNPNASIIKVIGVGGGGSNAVAHMFEKGITGVDFAVCNTDIQALEASPIENKIQLGPSLTSGMGAGNKPEMGKQSCIESIDEVRRFLDSGTKMLFVTAGMGGGTGTGAAPIIAKAAKEMDILTVGIVTIPFGFEGLKRKRQALEGLKQLKESVDSVLIISNDRLGEIYGDLPLSEAFGKADDILTIAAKGIAEIITLAGKINVDFEDVNTVMKNSGVSLMGSAVAEGEDRARRAVESVLNSPLLEDNDIRGANQILLNISSSHGAKEMTMSEMRTITDYIMEEAGQNIDVIWGHGYDESLGDKISITLIATGFDKTKTFSEPKKPQSIRVGIDDGDNEDQIIPTNTTTSDNAVVIDLDTDDVRTTIEQYRPATEQDAIIKIESADTDVKSQRMEAEKQRLRDEYVRKAQSRPLDDPHTISEMEKRPAFERNNVQLDDVSTSEDAGFSNIRISVDEDFDPDNIKRGNAFLHDNVD